MSGVEAVVGLTASFVTLAGLSKKMHRLYVDVRGAEKEWQRYREGFQAVVDMKGAVTTLLAKHPEMCCVPIILSGDENQVPLVERLRDDLSAVMGDAKELIDKATQAFTGGNNSRTPKLSNLARVFSRAWKFFKLVLDKETITKLMNRVEVAFNHLHMGLTLVSLRTSASLQSQMKTVLGENKAVLDENRAALGNLEAVLDYIKAILGQERPEDSRWLRDRRIGAGLRELGPSDVRPSLGKSQRRKDTLARKTRATKSKSKRASMKRHFQGFKRKIKPTPVPSKGKRSQELENVDGGHDADDESGDDGEQSSRDGAHNETQKTSDIASCNSGYEIIVENKQPVQKPVKSETGQQACGSQDADPSRTYATSATNIRLEDVLGTIPESELNEIVHSPVQDIVDHLTSAHSTTYTTDAEVTGEVSSPPITISSNRKSHILIAENVNLEGCREEAGGKFCVERVSVTDNSQGFCVIQPCAGQPTARCKHITMQVAGLDDFAPMELLARIEIASLLFNKLNSPDSPNWQNGSVASFPCRQCKLSPDNRKTNHTVMDHDGRAECAIQVGLLASLQPATDDSDAETERGLCESGNEGEQLETDQRESRSISPSSSRCPDDVNTVDDKAASNLLNSIVSEDLFDPPRSVTLDTLIRFLALMDRYSTEGQKKPLNQAKVWASAIQPPEVFDYLTVPWLWITWKLRMKDDFKKLSSLIQRQGRHSISIWQDGPWNIYNIRLPHSILNRLDQRRLDVLSRIRDKMDSLIDICREVFVRARTARGYHKPDYTRSEADMLTFSRAFGNLQLTRDWCLKPLEMVRDRTYLADLAGAGLAGVDFPGANFSWAKECISTMENMIDRETFGPLSKTSINKLRAVLSVYFGTFPELVNLVDTAVQEERRLVQLCVSFKDDIEDLIQQIESEGWGFDLDQIEE